MSIGFWSQFFLIYMAIALGFTRRRVELGLLWQGIHSFSPLQLIVAVVGSHRLSRSTLTAAASCWIFTKEIRNNPMPFLLEHFKLAERSGINAQKLWLAMIFAFFVFLQLR